jgi:hypothetical protein
MLESPHTLARMSIRGNTPPTSRSPHNQSRPEGYPPNQQPVTVCEEEWDGRGTTSRRTSTRAAPERRQPLTARHAQTTRTSSSHPREGVHHRRRTAAFRHAAGGGPGTGPRRRPPCPRNPPRHAPCQPQQEGGKGRCPVVSNWPLHSAMQQRCHHASASARSPSSQTMPRPRLQRAATARQEKFQPPIAEQNFRGI